jgi:hypothetical protein
MSRHAIFQTIVISFSIAAAIGFARPSSAASYEYLADATRKITNIDYAHVPLTPQDQAQIAEIACDTLGRLMGDPNFQRDIKTMMNEYYQKNSAAAQRFLGDIVAFSREFVRSEREQLLKAGFDPDVVGPTLLVAGMQRGQTKLDTVTENRIFEQIDQLRKAACALRDDLSKGLQTAVTEKRVELVIFGLFGVIMIVADATTELGSAGAATPVATLSTALGLAATQDAVRELISAR